MSNLAGLAVSDEEIVETVLRMLRCSGSTEAASLLRSSRWRFEQTGYDNWNGGTWIYTLYIEIDPGAYAALLNPAYHSDNSACCQNDRTSRGRRRMRRRARQA